MNNRAKLLLLAIVAVLVFAVLASGGSGGGGESTPDAPAPAPTSARLFPSIESESDCGTLQSIFDNAERAGEGARERGDIDLAQEHTEAMRRADDRMSSVGCY